MPQINQDAVRLMKKLYGIDMEETQHSKLIDVLPAIDVVVTMDCNVVCQCLTSEQREDWGLDDSTVKSDEEYFVIINKIEEKIKELAQRLN